MTIKELLTAALKESMKAGDKNKKQTVRMILSSIKNIEIDEKKTLDDDDIIPILHKQIKMRQDSLDASIQAGRDDLIEQNKTEIAIIKSFLPQAFTAEELESIVKGVIAETGATSMREMGLVMKSVLPKLKGKASSADASKVVKKLLA